MYSFMPPTRSVCTKPGTQNRINANLILVSVLLYCIIPKVVYEYAIMLYAPRVCVCAEVEENK